MGEGHYQDASDSIKINISLWRGLPHPGRRHSQKIHTKSEPIVPFPLNNAADWAKR